MSRSSLPRTSTSPPRAGRCLHCRRRDAGGIRVGTRMRGPQKRRGRLRCARAAGSFACITGMSRKWGPRLRDAGRCSEGLLPTVAAADPRSSLLLPPARLGRPMPRPRETHQSPVGLGQHGAGQPPPGTCRLRPPGPPAGTAGRPRRRAACVSRGPGALTARRFPCSHAVLDLSRLPVLASDPARLRAGTCSERAGRAPGQESGQ